MARFIQHPITHKLIPADEYEPPSKKMHYVHGDIESFVSPIDKSVITGRSHLREHNNKHGVTNIRDYGENYFERKAHERRDEMQGTTKKQRIERIDDIQRAMHQLERR